MLIPIAKTHSISRVVANLIIPQSIIKPDFLFKKIVDSKKLPNYQKRGITRAKTINLQDNSINVSKDEINGFIFEQFNAIGKSINILKVENTSNNKTQIDFENRDYSSWKDFKDRMFEEIKLLSEVFDIYIEAIALTYIDEFIWSSNESINIRKVFDEKSELLNTNFINSYNGTLILISQSERKENTQFEEEKTEVTFNNNLKRIVVNHTFAIKLSEISVYDVDNSGFLQSSFDKAHQTNKELLKKIFTKEVQESINLK